MRWLPLLLGALGGIAALPAGGRLGAQGWDSPEALALARRATERRGRAAGDTTLRDYRAQAHGFLFFLGQFGEGLTEPPRLVKTDQLELEVYWKAPGRSKQRIVGRRDRTDLPTDIRYHLDHLGIVQNNFGPRIRLGEGDEVRDVPHPFAPGGPAEYEFALGDSLTLALPDRAIRVVELRVRPRDFAAPRLVGSLFVEPESAELVRLVFSFTPAAYRDRQLEDLSIVLDNALYEGRWWLPYRQEVEIRRRAEWLDIPARGIIRGRWEVDGYVFNVGLADAWFAGPEIVALPQPALDSFPWPVPLEAAVQDVAEPVRRMDLETVRTEIAGVARGRLLTGVRPRRLAVERLSDVVHVNRVEGLTLGGGLAWRMGGRWEARAQGGYGFGGKLATGRLWLGAAGRRGPALAAYREVRDVSEWPIGSRLVNSLSAQEFGDDAGDYYSAAGARVAWREALGARWEWTASVAREWIDSLTVAATPATGAYRLNPALGAGAVTLGRLGVRRRSEGFAVRRDAAMELTIEGGQADGAAPYVRLAAAAHALLPLGATRLLLRGHAGWAGAGLPAHRVFVLGGRGTLLGDPFRAWGGAVAALVHAEWRWPAPFPRLPLGPNARTPGRVTVAPFLAAGAAGRPAAGAPWRRTDVMRVTVGLAVEWLGVLRVEAGWGAQSERIGVSVDVSRDFWDIL